MTVEVVIPNTWTVPDDADADADLQNAVIDGRVIKFNGDSGADNVTAFSSGTVTLMTPSTSGSYEFTTKSKSADGKFTKLDAHVDAITDPQPTIIVGNIAPGMGTVKVEPSKPVIGDRNVTFKVTFTAAGRMVTDSADPVNLDSPTPNDSSDDILTDRADIQISFPFGIVVDDIKSVTGGGVVMATHVDAGTSPNVDIMIPHLTKGQTIILTTNPIDIPADSEDIVLNTGADADNDNDTRESSFGAAAYTAISVNGIGGASGPTFGDGTLLTNGKISETSLVAAQITGGLLQPATDPGELTVTPIVLERGTAKKKILLTYKALRTHTDRDIVRITLPSVDGIKKGTSKTSTATATLSHADGATEIRWTIPNVLNRDKALVVEVQIDVPDSTDDLEFNYATGSTEPASSSSPVMVTVVGKAEDVRFEIVDLSNGNPIEASFPAASKQEIGFRFTAENTNIEADGYFKVTVPSNWPAVSRTGSASAAKVQISELTTEAIRDALPKTPLSASGRTITVRIDNSTTENRLKKGESITVQYGVKVADDKDYRAMIPSVAGEQMIRPEFKAYTGLTEYDLETITANVTRVADGSGMATITPPTARAGSSSKAIEVKFTAEGAMGGGAVKLTIPSDWGEMQADDAAAANHIAVRSPVKEVTLNTDSLVDGVAIADLPGGGDTADEMNAFKKGNYLTFVYGGAPGNVGAEVQDEVAVVSFTIESDGDGNGDFGKLSSTTAPPAAPAKPVGKIYKDADGALKIDVQSGADGSGIAKVDIVSTSVGLLRYDGGVEALQVHAADDVQLKFTYTADQRIQKGQLKLTIPTADGWIKPQDLTTGNKGYTRVDAPTGAAQHPTLGTSTVTVDIIDLAPGELIEIHYGAGSSTVDAPSSIGLSPFKMSIKGSETGGPVYLDTDPLTINVRSQASGAGTAAVHVTGDDLHAGDMDRELQIVYTAAGQMRGGDVKLTIPSAWSDPEGTADTEDNIEVTPAGAYEEVVFDADADGNYTVVAEDVDLAAGGAITFRYSKVMVQPTRSDAAQFNVAVFGGEQPFDDEDGTVAIADLTDLAVEVEEARPGSGTATISPTAVDADGDEAALTITYTAVGDIFYPKQLMVEVPTSWEEPTSGNRATDEGRYAVAGADERPPVGRKMVARVTQGTPVAAGGTITFTYNADPPTRPEISTFKVYYDGRMIAESPDVAVQPAGGATQIALMDVATLSVDAVEQMPVAVTVELQADDGSSAVAETDLVITLTSDSSTGMFVADPDAADAMYADEVMITIAAGMWDGMAYYMDETLGDYMITATADDATFDTVMTPVAVKTDVVGIDIDAVTITDSEGVEKDFAMAGDMVTITATGTSDKTVTAETVDGHANPSLREDPAGSGSYSGSFMVVSLHPDDTYDVTVDIDDGGDTDTEADAFTIDTTGPKVTVSDIEGTVADGGEVMISATVSDGTGSGIDTVTADVSMLDTGADPVTLTDDDGDGTYIGSHDISVDNAELNGDKTITVTAMDNAGNGGESSTTVTLENALSFTSMIPSGISLFHVPLDDPKFNTIGDLRTAIGDAKVSSLIAYDAAGELEPDSDNMPIAGGSGIIVILHNGSEATVTFAGEPWSGDNAKITLEAGDTNLIGLPLDIEGVDKISDIIGLDAAIEGVYPNLTDFVAAPNDAADGDVKGDAAYYVLASAAATITVSGDGWSDSAGMMAGAAPIALSGYKVDSQTPVLSVFGSVVDEITGVGREGFRVKVKNLSTKAAVSEITSIETADGYSMTLLDLANANAARVGDVLEISADSPNPLIGVKPVRHTVTVDDVKNSTIQLEELIAYEIPAETELLRNYPNPFNPETWIPYRLAEDADVSLTIYDTSGALVRSIDIGHQTAAVYETRAKAIYWDGRNRFGEQVASGLYFYHLSAGDFSGTRRMVILK